MEVYISAVEQM